MSIFPFFLFLLSFNFILNYDEKDFTNEEIKRKINLKQSIISISNEIRVSIQNSDENIYTYLVPKNNTKSLVRITATNIYEKKLQIRKVLSDEKFDYYEIVLKGYTSFIVNEDHFEKLEFKPKNIEIKEEQLEYFRDTINMISPYLTKNTVTTVYLPSENTRLIKYTSKSSNRSGDRIIYSLSENFQPFERKTLYIHYENNAPLTVMNYATKTFQVSHWGNIAVTEQYQIENIGAKLIGEFGRIDYDEYSNKGGKNALKEIRATLPLRSWGLWYRDEIGNVSTSVATRQWNDVSLVLHPRFPILGGWKSNYDIGYNLPSKFHVTTNGKGNYRVNLTFGMPYQNMLARDYTVKVTLPEKADNINVTLPIDAEYEISYDKEYGCLDMFGRKSVIIKVNNMYDAYNCNVYISYDYQWTMLFVKPVILIVYFLILFAIMIIYSRANVSLSRNTSSINENGKEKKE